jgi:hypothetical protein
MMIAGEPAIITSLVVNLYLSFGYNDILQASTRGRFFWRFSKWCIFIRIRGNLGGIALVLPFVTIKA